MLRLDLHVHTRHSKDSTAPIPSVVRHCQNSGLDLVAITDHGTIDGALEVERSTSLPLIIGEEVNSGAGDIICLFLMQSVPNGLSPLETVREIKDQGGLVLVPHPFDRLRPSALRYSALMEILPFIDLIEGYNSHTFFPIDNYRGVVFAREHSLRMVACSDAHSALELGNTYTEVPDFDGTAAGLFQAAGSGRMAGRTPNPLWLMAPGFARLRKALR